MARGWESKSVADQQEQAEREEEGKRDSAEDVKTAQRRRSLELSISRVRHQLEASTHPNHRAMLERALADLNKSLADLNGTSKS